MLSEFYINHFLRRENLPNLRSAIFFAELLDVSALEGMKTCLHPLELERYSRYTSEVRSKSYLLGRYCAKKAIGRFGNITDLNYIHIESGIFRQPVVQSPYSLNVSLSISHSDNSGIAIAYPESHPMSIDIEGIEEEKAATINDQLTGKEKEFIQAIQERPALMNTILWTSKECLGKVLKTGLTTHLEIFEIDSVKISAEGVFTCTFKNFVQYHTCSMVYKEKVITVLAPKKTQMSFLL